MIFRFYGMDLIATSYGNFSSDEEDYDPWASSRVSTKRIAGGDELTSRPVKKLASDRLPAPR